MRLIWIECILITLPSFGVFANAQLTSQITGQPLSCKNEIGEIELRFRVVNRFTNDLQVPVAVKIGDSQNLNFMLFGQKDNIDPASAVYQSDPDSVEPPATHARTLRAGEAFEWSTTAVITIQKPGSLGRLPEPGTYFLLPFPDLEVAGHPASIADQMAPSRLIPLQIDIPKARIRSCK